MTDSSEERFVSWLRTVTRRAAAAGRRHPVRLDCGVAVSIAAVSLIGLAVQHRLHHVDTIVFCVLLCAPLPLRSRSRQWSFGLVAAVALAQWLLSTPQLADAAVLVALFWITLDGELREIPVAGAITEAGAIMAAARWSPDEPTKVWVGVTGLLVASGALGLALRERRALIASLRDRAARLELERDQQGRLATAAERARIAREMHDIVSHNLTVMISLADGAQYALDASPDSSRTAMERVSATGREALVDMRRLLGVLGDRADAGTFAPQPRLDRLDELLARVEAAGIPVAVELDGDPRDLSEAVQLTIFRVAQEALTNTLRHAGRPAEARVALRCDHHRVSLEVTDTGSAPAGPASPSLGGQGLRGMRERAAAYGGQLEAGPLTGGGWRVRLVLAAEAQGVGR